MWATHNTGDYVLNVMHEVAKETPLGHNERCREMKRGFGGRGNEVIVRSAKKIIENHLPQLTLVQVVPDLHEHGINTSDKRRGGGLVSFDGTVDEPVEGGFPDADTVGRTRGGRDGVALVENIFEYPADGFGEMDRSQSGLNLVRKGKVVGTPKLTDMEGAVGLFNRESVHGGGRGRETGGRGYGGRRNHRGVCGGWLMGAAVC